MWGFSASEQLRDGMEKLLSRAHVCAAEQELRSPCPRQRHRLRRQRLRVGGVGSGSSSGAGRASPPAEGASSRAVSPNARLGQGTSHDSEHRLLQELVLFVFQGTS